MALGQAALREESDCSRANATAEGEVCAESVALCELAGPLADRDAEARCGLAQDSCSAARERAASLCATNAPAP